jgi:hypothetical protein
MSFSAQKTRHLQSPLNVYRNIYRLTHIHTHIICVCIHTYILLQVGGLTCRWERHSVKPSCWEFSTTVEQAKTQLRVVVPIEEEEVYIYIYTHTHIYIHTHTHTHTHIYIYTHMSSRLWNKARCRYRKTHLNFYCALSLLVTETEAVSLNQETGSCNVSAAMRCKLMRRVCTCPALWLRGFSCSHSGMLFCSLYETRFAVYTLNPACGDL